jgi:epoxyqueuosine reductase
MPVNPHELSQALKAEACRLGFQLVGITTPDPPAHFEVYQRWLQAGRHAEMGYLAADRALECRQDPLKILPECRSILVLGIPHDAPRTLHTRSSSMGNKERQFQGEFPKDHILYGRVAAYAWGADYHDVLPERMAELVRFIESTLGYKVPNRWYTDTGPILERDFAQRAGLGWIGKNTCLINPRLGSFFLLGTILLGLELEPDEPFTHDRCGTCTRCVDACPTGCILPDRTIDSRRCISYLTIELKGSIPPGLRGLIGDWVFGCDICQQVCPWNQRFAPLKGDPAFSEENPISKRDLLGDLNLTPQAFNRFFKGSPLKRAKRRGYLRNVAVALGNKADQRALPGLSKALRGDAEPLVRAHAAWGLGNIGGDAARTALKQALVDENDPEVLTEIENALQTL